MIQRTISVRRTGGDLQTATPSSADDALWFALCIAPDEGTDVSELMRLAGMSRATLYRSLAERARAGRAVPGQPWPLARSHYRGAATVSSRLTVRLISCLARASARKRAYTSAETNAETTTHRHSAAS